MARRHGWSEDQINHLAEFAQRPDFSAREKSALAFAERMTKDSNKVNEELWTELRRHFEEGEIVELASVIGLFNYFNRFNNALRMEPTK